MPPRRQPPQRRDDTFVLPPEDSAGAAQDVFVLPDDETPADTGNVDLRATPAPGRGPAKPRRGLVEWLGDVLTSATTALSGGEAAVAARGQGLRAASAARQAPPDETRRMTAVADRSTPEERAASARAQLRAGAVVRPDPTGIGIGRAAGARESAAGRAQNQALSAARERRTPANLRAVASKAREVAAAKRAAGDTTAADDLETKARNTDLFAENLESADTFGAIAESNLFGLVRDPYAGQRTNILTGEQDSSAGQYLFTEEEQRALGVTEPVAATRDFDPSLDLAAPAAGQLPVIMAGGIGGRAAALGAAEVAAARGFPRVASLATRLGTVIEAEPALGPRQAGLAGVREAGREFARVAPTIAARGAVEGNLLGAAIDARLAQQSGAPALEVGATSLALGAGLGALAELGLSAAGRAAGLGFDPVRRGVRGLADRIRLERAEGRANNILDGTEAALATAPAQAARTAADAQRAADGQLPIGDQMPEAQFRQLLGGLDELHRTRSAEERLTVDPVVPTGPAAGPAALAALENPPLRTAADLAMDQTAPATRPPAQPIDQFDAVWQMVRAQEAAEAERAAVEAELASPDIQLEQAAQLAPRERQGPLTLAQTLARAGRDADAGEPLAIEYKEAVNQYVDAAARVRDAGEGARTADRVALARAREALQRARERYGRQFGASAVLAVAGAEALSDEEARWGGGESLLAATGAGLFLPRAVAKRILRGLGRVVDRFGLFRDARMTPGQWIESLGTAVNANDAELAALREHLVGRAGGEDARLTLGDVEEALQMRAAAETDAPNVVKFIEGLPQKWDRGSFPAHVWMQQLHANNAKGGYTLAEYREVVLPALREAEAEGRRLSRGDLLQTLRLAGGAGAALGLGAAGEDEAALAAGFVALPGAARKQIGDALGRAFGEAKRAGVAGFGPADWFQRLARGLDDETAGRVREAIDAAFADGAETLDPRAMKAHLDATLLARETPPETDAGAGAPGEPGTAVAVRGSTAVATRPPRQLQEGFYSRLVETIEQLPKRWDEKRPLEEWIAKLQGMSTFSRVELDRVLDTPLGGRLGSTLREKAAQGGWKMTRAELLQFVEDTRPQLGRVTLATPPGQPDVTRNAIPAQLDAEDLEALRTQHAEGTTTREDYDDAIEARENSITQSERVIEERIDELRTTVRGTERDLTEARSAVDEAANIFDGWERAVERAIEYLDDRIDGEYIPRRAVQEAYNKFAEYVDTPYESLEDLGYRIEPVDHAAERRVEVWRRDNQNVTADLWYSRDVPLDDIRAEIEQRFPSERWEWAQRNPEDLDDEWRIVDENGEERERGTDRDALYADFHASATEGRYDEWYTNVKDALETYAEKRAEYNVAESEHYYAAEGEQFDEERAEIDAWREQITAIKALRDEFEVREAARVAREADEAARRTGADPEWYRLTDEERAFVERGRERGAIGTIGPLMTLADDDNNAGHAAAGAYVFDPDIPHTPFPRGPRERPVPDPDQLALFELPEGPALPAEARVENLMPIVRAEDVDPDAPFREPVEPKIKGAPGYSSYQRIGGGRNYRELVTVWDNPPAHLTSDAYGGHDYWSRHGILDAVGHLRAEDHDVTQIPGVTGSTVENVPGELPAAREKRSQLRAMRVDIDNELARLAEIGREFDALPESERMGPRANQLAQEYRAANSALEALAREAAATETELLLAINRGGGNVPAPRTVAVMLESQASLAQHQVADEGLDIDWSDPQGTRERAAAAVDEARAWVDRMAREERAIRDEAVQAIAPLDAARDELETALLARLGQGGTPERAAYARAVYDRRLAIGATGTTPEFAHLPSVYDLDSPAYGPEWDVALERAPELAALRANVEAAKRVYQGFEIRARNAAAATLHARNVLSHASMRFSDIEHALAKGREDVGPWADTAAAQQLNAARFLLDAAERGYEQIAWSTGANRIQWANLTPTAARYWYDRLLPAAMKRLLATVGFPDVQIEPLFIRGASHHTITLTPAMRVAIRKYGFPLLGVVAAMGLPDDAAAQANGTETAPKDGRLWLTAAGGVAAGGLLVAMAGSKALRRLVKQNAALTRELLLDDLSGLGNRKAFHRARARIDRDPGSRWVVFDANRFKAINDTHGHGAGDQAIAHFGAAVRDGMRALDLQGEMFRVGGDEFAVAVPADRASELLAAIEQRSSYTTGEGDRAVTTSLTGEIGHTFDEADTKLVQRKAEARGDTRGERGLTAYSNPLGPALRELARYPKAATLAGAATLIMESDDEAVANTGRAMLGLAALSAIGAARIFRAGDTLADTFVRHLRESKTGTSLVRWLDPERLLDPSVREAILAYERGRAKGRARAAEFSGAARRLGPSGDRAVSDVIENEGWEDTNSYSPDQMTAVLTVAAELAQEYTDLAQQKVAAGVIQPGALLPNYAGPRRHAYHAAQEALAERPSAASRRPGRAPRIAAEHARTLDIPVREAERALAAAQATGDPAAIQAAESALGEARAVNYARRVELGEIREASYRAAEGIERGYSDVAAAQLFETISKVPGTMHPDWLAARADVEAAEQLVAAATTPADKDQAKILLGDAIARKDRIERKFRQKDGEYITLADTRGLGKLRGAVVKRDVATSLQGVGDWGRWSKLLQGWKELKTVFNPGTHAANVVSNIGFAHMEGLHMIEQPVYLTRAAKDMKAYGPVTRALAEAGVLDQNVVDATSEGVAARELRTEEGLEQLLTTTRPETAAALRQGGITEARTAAKRRRSARVGGTAGALLGAAAMADEEDPELAAVGGAIGAAAGATLGRLGARRAARKLYANEDNIFRVAIAMKRVQQGDTIEQATEYARTALGHFRSRSPALNLVRQTVAPFILYPAKALPRFAHQVIEHPWRYMTLVAAWAMLDQYAQSQVGEVPEADVALKDRRGSLGYLLPGFVQLPFVSEKGERAATDMARWTPLSGLTTVAPPGAAGSAFDERYPSILQPSGPFVDLAAKLGANVDIQTGREHFRRDYPLRENIATALNDVAEVGLPPALGFHRRRVVEDARNRDWPKLRTDLLGPTGLRPRFIRPGANTRGAVFQLQTDLTNMKYDLQRETIAAANNPARQPVIAARFQRRLAKATALYRERTGGDPPPELLRELLGDAAEPEEPPVTTGP